MSSHFTNSCGGCVTATASGASNEDLQRLREEMQKLKDEYAARDSWDEERIFDVRPGAGEAASGAAVESRQLGAMGAKARRAGCVGAVF